MKKKIIKVILFLAIVVLGFFVVNKMFGQQYNKSLEGRSATISFSEVNLRSSYSTKSEIISTLNKGDAVILTGYSYDYIGDGESFDSWVEVVTEEDGISGWVVAKSVDW